MSDLHWAGTVAAGPKRPPRSSTPRTCNREKRMSDGCQRPRERRPLTAAARSASQCMSGLGGGLRATNTNTSAHTARIACRAAKESAASGTSRGRPSDNRPRKKPTADLGRSLPTRHALPLLCARFLYHHYCYCTESCLHMTWHFFNLFYECPAPASPAR
jgi:hypothetical protein